MNYFVKAATRIILTLQHLCILQVDKLVIINPFLLATYYYVYARKNSVKKKLLLPFEIYYYTRTNEQNESECV